MFKYFKVRYVSSVIYRIDTETKQVICRTQQYPNENYTGASTPYDWFQREKNIYTEINKEEANEICKTWWRQLNDNQ